MSGRLSDEQLRADLARNETGARFSFNRKAAREHETQAAVLRELLERREEAEVVRDALRQFEHVEGEALTEMASVASTSFDHAKHRADSAERELLEARAALTQIAESYPHIPFEAGEQVLINGVPVAPTNRLIARIALGGARELLEGKEPCPACGCPGDQYDGHVCEEYMEDKP